MLLCQTLLISLVIKWMTYPLSQLMSEDDQDRFASTLIQRDELVRIGGYPTWYMTAWDILQLLDMLWHYVGDKISNSLTLNIRIR